MERQEFGTTFSSFEVGFEMLIFKFYVHIFGIVDIQRNKSRVVCVCT